MKRNQVLLAVAAVAVAVVVGGAYLASPFLAVQSLRRAAQAHDREKLETLVDFPSVRESLKAQMKAQLMKSMQEDPQMRDNPFAGFAMAMAPMIVDGAVESFVTPEAMSTLVREGKPGPARPATAPASKSPDDDVSISQDYKDLDTFHVTLRSKADPAAGPTSLVFKRTGLFHWQLKRVQLALDALPKR